MPSNQPDKNPLTGGLPTQNQGDTTSNLKNYDPATQVQKPEDRDADNPILVWDLNDWRPSQHLGGNGNISNIAPNLAPNISAIVLSRTERYFRGIPGTEDEAHTFNASAAKGFTFRNHAVKETGRDDRTIPPEFFDQNLYLRPERYIQRLRFANASQTSKLNLADGTLAVEIYMNVTLWVGLWPRVASLEDARSFIMRTSDWFFWDLNDRTDVQSSNLWERVRLNFEEMKERGLDPKYLVRHKGAIVTSLSSEHDPRDLSLPTPRRSPEYTQRLARWRRYGQCESAGGPEMLTIKQQRSVKSYLREMTGHWVNKNNPWVMDEMDWIRDPANPPVWTWIRVDESEIRLRGINHYELLVRTDLLPYSGLRDGKFMNDHFVKVSRQGRRADAYLKRLADARNMKLIIDDENGRVVPLVTPCRRAYARPSFDFYPVMGDQPATISEVQAAKNEILMMANAPPWGSSFLSPGANKTPTLFVFEQGFSRETKWEDYLKKIRMAVATGKASKGMTALAGRGDPEYAVLQKEPGPETDWVSLVNNFLRKIKEPDADISGSVPKRDWNSPMIYLSHIQKEPTSPSWLAECSNITPAEQYAFEVLTFDETKVFFRRLLGSELDIRHDKVNRIARKPQVYSVEWHEDPDIIVDNVVHTLGGITSLQAVRCILKGLRAVKNWDNKDPKSRPSISRHTYPQQLSYTGAHWGRTAKWFQKVDKKAADKKAKKKGDPNPTSDKEYDGELLAPYEKQLKVNGVHCPLLEEKVDELTLSRSTPEIIGVFIRIMATKCLYREKPPPRQIYILRLEDVWLTDPKFRNKKWVGDLMLREFDMEYARKIREHIAAFAFGDRRRPPEPTPIRTLTAAEEASRALVFPLRPKNYLTDLHQRKPWNDQVRVGVQLGRDRIFSPVKAAEIKKATDNHKTAGSAKGKDATTSTPEKPKSANTVDDSTQKRKDVDSDLEKETPARKKRRNGAPETEASVLPAKAPNLAGLSSDSTVAPKTQQSTFPVMPPHKSFDDFKLSVSSSFDPSVASFMPREVYSWYSEMRAAAEAREMAFSNVLTETHTLRTAVANHETEITQLRGEVERLMEKLAEEKNKPAAAREMLALVKQMNTMGSQIESLLTQNSAEQVAERDDNSIDAEDMDPDGENLETQDNVEETRKEDETEKEAFIFSIPQGQWEIPNESVGQIPFSNLKIMMESPAFREWVGDFSGKLDTRVIQKHAARLCEALGVIPQDPHQIVIQENERTYGRPPISQSSTTGNRETTLEKPASGGTSMVRLSVGGDQPAENNLQKWKSLEHMMILEDTGWHPHFAFFDGEKEWTVDQRKLGPRMTAEDVARILSSPSFRRSLDKVKNQRPCKIEGLISKSWSEAYPTYSADLELVLRAVDTHHTQFTDSEIIATAGTFQWKMNMHHQTQLGFGVIRVLQQAIGCKCYLILRGAQHEKDVQRALHEVCVQTGAGTGDSPDGIVPFIPTGFVMKYLADAFRTARMPMLSFDNIYNGSRVDEPAISSNETLTIKTTKMKWRVPLILLGDDDFHGEVFKVSRDRQFLNELDKMTIPDPWAAVKLLQKYLGKGTPSTTKSDETPIFEESSWTVSDGIQGWTLFREDIDAHIGSLEVADILQSVDFRRHLRTLNGLHMSYDERKKAAAEHVVNMWAQKYPTYDAHMTILRRAEKRQSCWRQTGLTGDNEDAVVLTYGPLVWTIPLTKLAADELEILAKLGEKIDFKRYLVQREALTTEAFLSTLRTLIRQYGPSLTSSRWSVDKPGLAASKIANILKTRLMFGNLPPTHGFMALNSGKQLCKISDGVKEWVFNTQFVDEYMTNTEVQTIASRADFRTILKAHPSSSPDLIINELKISWESQNPGYLEDEEYVRQFLDDATCDEDTDDKGVTVNLTYGGYEWSVTLRETDHSAQNQLLEVLRLATFPPLLVVRDVYNDKGVLAVAREVADLIAGNEMEGRSLIWGGRAWYARKLASRFHSRED